MLLWVQILVAMKYLQPTSIESEVWKTQAENVDDEHDAHFSISDKRDIRE